MSRAKVMISSAVYLDDRFLDLSFEAQALYTHLNVQADNDGVVDGVKRALRGFGCDTKAYNELIDAGYLCPLDNTVVILHYWVNNNRDSKYGHGQHYERLKSRFEFDRETRTYMPKEQPTEDAGEHSANSGRTPAPNIKECNAIEPNVTEEKESNQNQNNSTPGRVTCPECGEPAFARKNETTGEWVADCIRCGKIVPLSSTDGDFYPFEAA